MRNRGELYTATAERRTARFGLLAFLAALLILTTGPGAQAAPAPCADLVVNGITVAVPLQLFPTTVVVAVRNAGTCPTGPFAVQWRSTLAGAAQPAVPVPSGLLAGGTASVPVPYTFATAGGYLTSATVDSGRTVAETNEWNNSKSAFILVAAPKPDLVVTNVVIDPGQPYPGLLATARITVKNIGALPAGPFQVQWRPWLFGAAQAASVPGLFPGASTSVDLAYAFPYVGHFDGTAWVDSMDAVVEFSELNNTAATAVDTVPPTLNAQKVNQPGFGDSENTFSWSMAWFEGKLYVGTNRSFRCVETITLDFYYPGQGYYRGPLDPLPEANCPVDPYDLDLRAEIWQYTPATGQWQRVYQSLATIPNPRAAGKFVARDIGFRGMTVYTDPSSGDEALYVAGVTAGEYIPELAAANPPRILRSVDGQTFTPLNGVPNVINTVYGAQNPVGFRDMEILGNRLFVTASAGLLGEGVVLEVKDASTASPSYVQVTPATMQVYETAAFNGTLYIGTASNNLGYSVEKVTNSTTTPFSLAPVVTGGAGRPATTAVVSMHVFKGRLYVGADGWGGTVLNTEEIRINPDDSWDLVVGAPRTLPSGVTKTPISGLGDGFGNFFAAHVWRAVTHNGAMYIGTNDSSYGFANVPGLGTALQPEFGFDIWGTCDGQYWWQVTRNAFGDGRWNFGARTMVSTPSGLFIGSTNHVEGTSVWKGNASPCGALVPLARSGGQAGSGASTVAASPLPPRRLLADTQSCGTVLSWDATSGARRYQVLRSDHRALDLNLAVQPKVNGRVVAGAVPMPARPGSPAKRQRVWVAGPYRPIGITSESSFVDRGTKPGGRYTYQVVALGADGKASQPSNTATLLSQSATTTFAQLDVAVQRLIDASSKTRGAVRGATLLRLVTLARTNWQHAGPSASLQALDRLRSAAALPVSSRAALTVAMGDVQNAILQLERRASLGAVCSR